MAASDDDQSFERIIAKNIEAGLHSRRGLTADEYTAICRKAWDDCLTSPKFPFKILIDPLQSGQEMLIGRAEEYIHWRAADTVDALREPSTEIRCEAFGSVGADFATGPDVKESVSSEEPDVPETRRYILAVFDVLGFSALLQSRG
jgi:hypothetical protein